MAYDLMVGTSPFIKDSPEIIAGIEFDEMPALSALCKRKDSFFLNRICNLFEDQSFSLEEIEQAMQHLHPLLLERLKPNERTMLHKLIAVLSYASSKKQSLFGVAD